MRWLVFMVVSSVAVAAPCPVRASGPTDEWPVQLVSRDTKAATLDALEQFAFTLESTDAERSARGFDASKRLSWCSSTTRRAPRRAAHP